MTERDYNATQKLVTEIDFVKNQIKILEKCELRYSYLSGQGVIDKCDGYQEPLDWFRKKLEELYNKFHTL